MFFCTSLRFVFFWFVLYCLFVYYVFSILLYFEEITEIGFFILMKLWKSVSYWFSVLYFYLCFLGIAVIYHFGPISLPVGPLPQEIKKSKIKLIKFWTKSENTINSTILKYKNQEVSFLWKFARNLFFEGRNHASKGQTPSKLLKIRLSKIYGQNLSPKT